MGRFVGSVIVAFVIVVFGYYVYFQPAASEVACDRAIQSSIDAGPSFAVRSHASTVGRDSMTVTVAFSTANADGTRREQVYGCDLARQADGAFTVVKVYPAQGAQN
jgi:acyl-CoA hydrolase